MVFVALYHAAGAVNICLFPFGIIGKPAPWTHSVRFDVCFVADVYTKLIAILKQTRIVRIVACADHVDVVRLHDEKVTHHVIGWSCVSEQVMAVVAVYALCLNLLAVYINNLVFRFNASESDGNTNILCSALKIKGVESRCFITPEQNRGDGYFSRSLAVSKCDSTLRDCFSCR